MEIDRSKISPMMQQYFEVKDKYQDCVLFFRLGDFYEMFFDDAVVVSKALELTLTGRDCGLEERAPMCGVPYHAADMYIKRLIDMGFKVAVCEQLTDPAETKGIVVRDVIRVVTPGTLTESSMLDDGSNNYICSIYYDEEEKTCGVASADLSTGEAALSFFEGKDLEAGVINELSRCQPAEIIFPQNFLSLSTIKIIVLGLIAFSMGTAFGVLFGKLMYKFTGGKVNPLIGSAGVSAVPMAARVSQKVGQQENPGNFLLMHAMGPNVAGVIGSAVAAGVLLNVVGH